MMLVQYGNSDVPISLAYSVEADDGPDHGIVGPRSGWDLEDLRSGRHQQYGSDVKAQADLASNGTEENSVLSFHIL